MYVLLFDDEQKFCRGAARALRSHGIIVDAVHDVDAFFEAVAAGKHEAILIDWNLRTCEGSDLCVQLRRDGERRPIAILSGKLDAEYAMKIAKRAGADDFLSKPMAAPEFAARIRRLAGMPLRPSGTYRLDDDASTACGFEIHADGYLIVHEHRIRLRGKEHALFTYLVAHSGHDVTNDELIEHVFGLSLATTGQRRKAQDHLVQVHVSRLREKLGSAVTIRTVTSGYRVDGAAPRVSKKV